MRTQPYPEKVCRAIEPFTTAVMADLDIEEGEEEEILSVDRRIKSFEHYDPTDETQDFRFATLISGKSGAQLPKRGEKDFEPHGTKHQESVLDSSRNAMYDALSYVRSHTPKNHVRGFYYGNIGRIKRDEKFGKESRNGLEDDYIVLVESAKGPHFKTMGKMTTKQKTPSLWLLPEEALYLVERGFLDLWWPAENSDTTNSKNDGIEKNEGTPMSLQAAYAMLIGNDRNNGKVSLNHYTVYANLRRTGYVVQRAPTQKFLEDEKTARACDHQFAKIQANLFALLFGSFFGKKRKHYFQYGPLVMPGMYRSYNTIYQKLAIISRHRPVDNPHDSAMDSKSAYQVVYLLWKGDNLKLFTKKNPGHPDFRVAIVDAHSTPIPSLLQINSLLKTVSFNPPNSEKLKGSGNTYQRLKHGWRQVTIAVVDQGVISYLKLVEAAFGEELMYERFNSSGVRVTKRGYRGGVGRSRGQGHNYGRA